VKEWGSRKRVIDLKEVLGWLEETGFALETIRGDHRGNPANSGTGRAIIWAVKKYR
jgi:predicted RNA binding protein YcfA (HicA-like mRNA interferase family)